MEKKYLFCKECGNFPDSIWEEYRFVEKKRVWNNDCYELEESLGIDEGADEVLCGVCRSKLEDRGD